jgi:hypothetical protein
MWKLTRELTENSEATHEGKGIVLNSFFKSLFDIKDYTAHFAHFNYFELPYKLQIAMGLRSMWNNTKMKTRRAIERITSTFRRRGKRTASASDYGR